MNDTRNLIKGSNAWAVFALILVITISPVVGLVLSICFFKQIKISILLFIFFAFYFGWFYEPQLDLLVHYKHFKSLIGKNLLDAWTAPSTIHLGKEFYPVLFKYTLGCISNSANLFSACACAIYACVFSGVLYSIREYYILKMTPLQWAAFLGVIFTVEYNWFLGFRFWTGAFVFLIFFLKYMKTYQLKYLLLAATACLFHFAHIILPLVFVLDYIFGKSMKARFCFVAVGMYYRYSEINIFQYIPKLQFLKGYIKNASFNADIVKNVNERMEEIRTYGNQFYLMRNEIIFLALLLVFILLYKRNKDIINYNSKYFNYMLVFYGIINLGYMDFIFFDREYKLLILMMFIYLLMYIKDASKEIGSCLNIKLSLPLFVAVLYAIATIVVSQRMYLWKMEIWFNSFIV